MNGARARDHLQAAADRGNLAALAYLQGPDCPVSLAYLVPWVMALHGRSGVGMNGAAPLTYSTVVDWAQLTGNLPNPFEVDTLMTLDSVLRHPEVADAPAKEAPRRAWPEKKG